MQKFADQEIETFIDSSPETPLFLRAWWLDIVAENKPWHYLVSKSKSGDILGILPLIVEQKAGMSLARMTPLTPFLGPWLAPFTGQKKAQKISYEQKVLADLIQQIPPLVFFAHKFSPEIKNWYPFYLQGFEQTTHYTYILDDIIDEKKCWDNLKNTVRTDIRKAKDHFTVVDEQDADALYYLQEKTFQKQQKTVPFSKDLMIKLVETCFEKKCGKTIFIQNHQEEKIAGAFIVWDQQSAYLLLLGVDESKNHHGAVQYLIWESIRKAAHYVSSFNFEGTMLPNVEPVFRRFGGEKTPYYKVWKDRNKLTKLLRIALGK